MVYHELTHILANDNSRGFFRFLRGAFGSVAKPNAYLPLWMMEGQAVFQETEHSGYGRGRSIHLVMLLRTAVREGLFSEPQKYFGFSLDQLNDGPPHWPAGSTPYLLGYLLHEWVAFRKNAAAPGLLSHYAAGPGALYGGPGSFSV